MTGISTVAKIERGVDAVPGDMLTRATGGGVCCPGSADKGPAWKGQWRFRSTDPWSTVVNRNQMHIEYVSADAALAAARYTRNEHLKVHS